MCLNVGCIPSKALLKNAELAHTFTHKAQLFGISGDVSFDFGAAFDRSRKVSEGIVKGVHFLMKKNKITEIDGWGTITWEEVTAEEPVKRFASLQIQRDPSSGWVLAFSVLATLGLFAGLFVPRRRLWVKARTTPDGVHVEYAGLARGEDPALARAVDEFATRHAHALGVDQPAKDTP